MSLEQQLIERSNNTCELCNSTDMLSIYTVPPADLQTAENVIYVCKTCLDQIEKREQLDAEHWKVLSEARWSEDPAVQVVARRMISRLRKEGWAYDNLNI